jgi:hypothetical protein
MASNPLPSKGSKAIAAQRAIASADAIADALARVKALERHWRDEVDGSNYVARRRFFESLDVSSLVADGELLRDVVKGRPSAQKALALLSILIDCFGSAVNFDIEVFLPLAEQMLALEPPLEIFSGGSRLGSFADGGDIKLAIDGFAPEVLALTVRRLLRASKFLPAISEIVEEATCARSSIAHASIDAKRLLARRDAFLAREPSPRELTSWHEAEARAIAHSPQTVAASPSMHASAREQV